MRNTLLALAIVMIAIASLTTSCKSAKDTFEDKVSQAIDAHMATYPKSTLKDLYKTFFQDKYGPGHIIADTTSAGSYLRQELASYETVTGPYAEPTGWEGNYVRVNLSVLKEGKVDYQTFFDSFVRSVNGIVPPSIEDWTKEWEAIESIIQSKDLSLPDYESDKAAIKENLAGGDYTGHHSTVFEKTYDPHYRIMSREIYEKEILPKLR